MEGGLPGAPLKILIFFEGIYFGGPWNHPKCEKFWKKIIGPFLLKINIFFMEGGLQGAPLKISIFLEGIYFGGPWNHPKRAAPSSPKRVICSSEIINLRCWFDFGDFGFDWFVSCLFEDWDGWSAPFVALDY